MLVAVDRIVMLRIVARFSFEPETSNEDNSTEIFISNAAYEAVDIVIFIFDV